MKRSHKIAISLAVVAAAGVAVYIVRSARNKKMLDQIADEGYETAQDILFPDKKVRNKHLRYGPVLPE